MERFEQADQATSSYQAEDGTRYLEFAQSNDTDVFTFSQSTCKQAVTTDTVTQEWLDEVMASGRFTCNCQRSM